MNHDPRIQLILDKLLESAATPEEACASCPDLLPEIRSRWQHMQRIASQLDVLFPTTIPNGPDSIRYVAESAAFPEIPGHEVQALIGRGGMGLVFLARHLRLNRVVAVKMALAGAYMAPHGRTRFQREAEAVAAIDHANIVQIHDVGDSLGRPYFTMEYVDGGSLASKLASAKLPAREAASLVAILAEAIHAAHEVGIVHRDLKPANVLITSSGVPKITDFGLALRTADDPGLTRTGAALGTPSYMAPEQAAGKHSAVGPAVDIHALGVILYELLTGRLPFLGESTEAVVQQVLSQEPVPPSHLNARIPRDLETICLKCLRKESSSRYTTAANLAKDLSRFLNGEAILARPEGVVERVVRRFRRRPALSFALLTILVLAVVGIWLYADKSASELRQLANREASERAADEHLRRMVGFLEVSAWDKARNELDQARARLDKNESASATELHRRMEQGEREWKLAARFEAIRLARAARLGKKNAAASSVQDYEAAFATEQLGETSESPDVVAQRIRQVSIRDALVAAIDDWAACTTDARRQDWLLAVARLADRDDASWRTQIRERETWQSKAALVELAPHVVVERSSTPLVLTLAEQMKKAGADPIPLLKRLQITNADDFWANLGLAEAHMEQNNLVDAIRYYQAAIALRKDATVVYDNLGLALALTGRFEDADEQLRLGSRLDPASMSHETLGIVYAAARRDDLLDNSELPRQFRERVASLHLMLGDDLYDKGKLDEALQRYRLAVAVEPKTSPAQYRVRAILTKQGKLQEVWESWHTALKADPPDFDAWDGYAEMCLYFDKEEEYRRVRRILLDRFQHDQDARVTELTGRASLLLPASPDELGVVETLIDRSLAVDEKNPYYHFAKGLLEYRRGHWDNVLRIMQGDAATVMGPAPRLIEAMALQQQGRADEARQTLAAAIGSFDWEPERADGRNAWIFHVLRREAETLTTAK